MSEIPARDIGTWLRDTRERSGLSLGQIADATKFSVLTLQALERNRIDQLPDGIYRRAIVRSYASQVGLDPEETLKAFLAAHPQDPATFPTVVVPAPPPRRVTQMFLGLVAAVAGAVLFSINGRASKPPDSGSRQPHPGSRAPTTTAR